MIFWVEKNGPHLMYFEKIEQNRIKQNKITWLYFFNRFQLGSQKYKKTVLNNGHKEEDLKRCFHLSFVVELVDMVFFFFFFPFVVEFSNCVQKGKKTQERKMLCIVKLPCGNPTAFRAKSLTFQYKYEDFFAPLIVAEATRGRGMIVLEVGTFLSSYLPFFGAKSSHMSTYHFVT